MAVVTYSLRNPAGVTTRPIRYFVCDALVDRPSTDLLEGDLAYVKANDTLYTADSTTTWDAVTGGGGGGGATALGELSDVDDAVAPTNGHFLVGDGTDFSNRALADGDIPAAIARDSEVTSAISTHAGVTTSVHGIADTSALVVDGDTTSTATASKIPIADGSGKLDTWISDASTTTKGKVELATDGENAANVAVQGNDSRLSNARTPTAHATDHQSGGSDAIKLDDLAAPDDNTDLNASTLKHGLLPKLSGNASDALKGDGTWGGISATETNTGSFAPGPFTVATGTWRLQMDTLEIGAAETVEVEGTGTLAVS